MWSGANTHCRSQQRRNPCHRTPGRCILFRYKFLHTLQRFACTPFTAACKVGDADRQHREQTGRDKGNDTIYRLFDRDMCLFSASCMMRSIQFEVTVSAEKDTDLWIIPVEVYQSMMAESAPVANYTSELMAARFSDVMWLIEQIMWKSLDKRIAAFLLEETSIEGTDTLKITHEIIANPLGSPREVITRMLKYFQNEGMVKLSRGTVSITDPEKLEEVCEA